MKGQWNAIFPNFWRTVVLSRSQLAVRTEVSVLRHAKNSFFCIPNMKTTVPFVRAISVRQLPFAVLSDNVF